MVSLQILNKVLTTKDLSIITDNNLSEEYFQGYENEYKYILDHYNKYNQVPDMETFLSTFQSFEPFEVTENDKYLLEKINEEHLYNDLVQVINKSAEYLKTDSITACEYLMSKIPSLQTTTGNTSTDIISQASERFNKYLEKQTMTANTSILTGLEELDQVIGGWEYGEELVTIVARTNQGKSWILLKFLMEAWRQGKRVLLYSGEMSATKLGYRFDALLQHFSNRNLVRGNDEPNYKTFIEELKQNKTPFIIVTQKDLNGRATVSKIRNLAKKYEVDIIGIDQYSLMEDERRCKGDAIRTAYANITEDLFKLSTEMQIPILGLVQSNREGAKSKEEQGTPELENVAESDAIVQNSSKVISLRQTGAGLELCIKKNREGQVGDKLLYFWDIDKGTFTYIPSSDDALKGEKSVQTKKEFKDATDVF